MFVVSSESCWHDLNSPKAAPDRPASLKLSEMIQARTPARHAGACTRARAHVLRHIHACVMQEQLGERDLDLLDLDGVVLGYNYNISVITVTY